MSPHSPRRASWRILLAVLTVLWLSGCGPTLQKVVREDPGGGFISVDAASAGQIVSVTRAGRPLDLRLPLVLQPGDIVETGAGGAVLRLPNGEALMAPRTRVRLGSLEVIFGRILADVRGLFRAEDDSVAADVEGTQFLFERRPGGATRVLVLEGTVRCTSKYGTWEMLRVSAGRQMIVGATGGPTLSPVAEAEMAGIRAWADTLRSAPERGWCCRAGRVSPALSNQCRGVFDTDARAAQRQCERGWCCHNGQVGTRIRAECLGSFHARAEDARAACTEPAGWCCEQGRITQVPRSRCGGQFFGGDATGARRACAPAPSTTTPGVIRGTVIVPDSRQILQATKVWCCVGGRVSQTDRAGCAERNGTAYGDEATARQRCVVIR